MKFIQSKIRRALQDFDMIQEGDKIAVGLSGGKDSLTLLTALKQMERYYPKKFTVQAVTVTMGYENFDIEPLKEFCKNLDVPYTIVETQIGPIIFDIRKEKSPCSLCANMRRGAVNSAAKEAGCNKVALGHHKNDGIETLFLSMMYEGRLSSFLPVTYLDRIDITVIRPMIYLEENYIKSYAKNISLPVVPSPCPVCGNTKREYVKNLITQLRADVPDINDKLLNCLTNMEQVRLWEKAKKTE